MAEQPFKIAVPDPSIELLKKKLDLTVFPDELEDAGRDYGVPLADLRRLVARWQHGYDWKKHEAQLNDELPQFTRDIEVEGFGTLNVHYVHKKSDVVDAIPLLFVHGWPGSFYEARKILPRLVEASPEHPSFHVVAFSLPGYGFSEAPKKPGFELTQFAEVGNKLMLALGYNEYGLVVSHVLGLSFTDLLYQIVTQGGDWGGLITRKIAQLYGKKHSKAWHTNFPMAPPPHPIHRPLLLLSHLLFSYTPAEQEGLKRTMWYRDHEIGYFMEQATQPQTLGYGLTDSPAGLLAWIYEKLVSWTDSYPWEDDEVLTWVSIYWFSRAGPTASLRIYYEVNQAYPTLSTKAEPTEIPMGHSYFPKELIVLPRRWLKASNLVFESSHETGGHFAAHEKPQELVDDLRKMFGKGGPTFGVVSGKTGYA